MSFVSDLFLLSLTASARDQAVCDKHILMPKTHAIPDLLITYPF